MHTYVDTYMHTYIHPTINHCNPDIAPHTTYVLCVNFMRRLAKQYCMKITLIVRNIHRQCSMLHTKQFMNGNRMTDRLKTEISVVTYCLKATIENLYYIKFLMAMKTEFIFRTLNGKESWVNMLQTSTLITKPY